jgi:hypothetical protein
MILKIGPLFFTSLGALNINNLDFQETIPVDGPWKFEMAHCFIHQRPAVSLTVMLLFWRFPQFRFYESKFRLFLIFLTS